MMITCTMDGEYTSDRMMAQSLAEAIYDLGGEASVTEISAETQISSSYVNYICKSMVSKGNLERVGTNIYALNGKMKAAMKKDVRFVIKDGKIYSEKKSQGRGNN